MSGLIEEKESVSRFKVLFLGGSGTEKTEVMTSLKFINFLLVVGEIFQI